MFNKTLTDTMARAAEYEKMRQAAEELPAMLAQQDRETKQQQTATEIKQLSAELDAVLLDFGTQKHKSDAELVTILGRLTGWVERRKQLNLVSQQITNLANRLAYQIFLQRHPEPLRPDEIGISRDEINGLTQQALIDRSPDHTSTLMYLKPGDNPPPETLPILRAITQLTGDAILKQPAPQPNFGIVASNGRGQKFN